jgi:uncharacterized coiled-coil protein SlyX
MLKKLALIIALCTSFYTTAHAQNIPQYMPFQGFLADLNGAPINRAVTLTFNLYANSQDANPIWTETVNNVPVQNGAFSINLGEIAAITAALSNGDSKYVGISIDGQAEILPRQKLGAIPYAFLADNASKLNGRTANEFTTEAQVRQLINQIVAGLIVGNNNGGLDANAVNLLIDARNYLNQPAIQALIDAAIAGLRNLLEARIAVVENRVGAVEQNVQNFNAQIQNQNAEIANLNAQIQNLTNQVNALNALPAQIQNLTNQVNALNALPAQVQNLTAQVQNLTNLVNQLQNNNVGAAPAEIVGVSATTSGRVSFGGKNGVQGATELCKAAFANSHVCSVSEANIALATNRYPAGVVGTETWTADPALSTSFIAGATLNPETCQSFQYNSGDVATGITLTVANYNSNGGGGNLAAHAIKVVKGRACGTALPVLCCK